jgi:hypothetical protein
LRLSQILVVLGGSPLKCFVGYTVGSLTKCLAMQVKGISGDGGSPNLLIAFQHNMVVVNAREQRAVQTFPLPEDSRGRIAIRTAQLRWFVSVRMCRTPGLRRRCSSGTLAG